MSIFIKIRFYTFYHTLLGGTIVQNRHENSGCNNCLRNSISSGYNIFIIPNLNKGHIIQIKL